MTVQQVIDQISSEISGVKGIVGAVLGGSRARGTNRANSDIDIGIYYDGAAGFDGSEVNRIATKLDDGHRENIVTSLGEWGAWVNGGGWLTVQGYSVDFLFRDIKRVSEVIDDCLAGRVAPHYQTGHPHAYMNVMYMGEISICKVLSDPTRQIAELKTKTAPYPKALKDAMLSRFMFEASFSCMLAEKNVDQDDSSYVAGHVYRSIACLNQAIFAWNGEYCINEKRAVRMIEGFPAKPDDYKERIDQVITLMSASPDRTREGLQLLQGLVSDTDGLVNGS